MCFDWLCKNKKTGSKEESECITLEGRAKKILSAFYTHPINVMKLGDEFKIKYILPKNEKIAPDIKKRIRINKLNLKQELITENKKEYVCQIIITLDTQQIETLINNIKKSLPRKNRCCFC